MTLSELFNLPEEERHAMMMEVAKKATDAQLKVMEEAEKIVNKEYNWKRLTFGRYLVRTQAGFKQAVKDFKSNYSEAYEDQTRGFDWPKAYPSIVSFHVDYQGAWYLQVFCTSVTSYVMKLSKALDEVINE